jgi:hypothetical protein
MTECLFCGAAAHDELDEHWPCPALPDPEPIPIDSVVADPAAGRYTERLTLRIPQSLETAIDDLVDGGAYSSRSQAIRAAAFEAFVAPRHTEQPCAIADGGGTDADSALEADLRAALEASACHRDFTEYCERAADRGGTPILESVRHLHAATDVSRVPVLGTAIETTLWEQGAKATLDTHGHVDETNTEILEAIVADHDRLATDGGRRTALPADDSRSIDSRLGNADAQLECALDRLDATTQTWLTDAIGALRADLRALRTLFEGDSDGDSPTDPEGRR